MHPKEPVRALVLRLLVPLCACAAAGCQGEPAPPPAPVTTPSVAPPPPTLPAGVKTAPDKTVKME